MLHVGPHSHPLADQRLDPHLGNALKPRIAGKITGDVAQVGVVVVQPEVHRTKRHAQLSRRDRARSRQRCRP